MIQIDFFITYTPTWLGPLLMVSGLTISVGPTLLPLLALEEGDSLEMNGIWSLFILGSFALALYFYWRFTFVFAVVLFFGGRIIEGFATTRFLSQVAQYFSTSTTKRGFLSRIVKTYLALFFLLPLIVLVAGWIALFAIVLGYRDSSLAVQFAVVWTAVVGTVSVFGVSWKLRPVITGRVFEIIDEHTSSEGGDVALPDTGLKYKIWIFGVVLMIVGAQLYNFTIFSTQLEYQQIDISISMFELASVAIGDALFVLAFLTSIYIRTKYADALYGPYD